MRDDVWLMTATAAVTAAVTVTSAAVTSASAAAVTAMAEAAGGARDGIVCIQTIAPTCVAQTPAHILHTNI